MIYLDGTSTLFIDSFGSQSSDEYYIKRIGNSLGYQDTAIGYAIENNSMIVPNSESNSHILAKDIYTVGDIEGEVYIGHPDKVGVVIKETPNNGCLYLEINTLNNKNICIIYRNEYNQNIILDSIEYTYEHFIGYPDETELDICSLHFILNKNTLTVNLSAVRGIADSDNIGGLSPEVCLVKSFNYTLPDHIYNTLIKRTPALFGLSFEDNTNSTSNRYIYKLGFKKPNYSITQRNTGQIPFNNPKYKFFLVDSITMNRIQDLTGASNKSINLIDNKAGKSEGVVPLDSVLAEKIEPVSTSILVLKNNIPVWSGPVWSVDEDVSNNTLTYTAVGWLALLEKRILRSDKIYTEQSPGDIIFSLLNYINNEQKGIDPNQTIPYYITPGTNLDTITKRTKTFEKGTTIMSAINSLIEIEAGCDIVVDPLTRELNVVPWNYKYNKQIEEGRNPIFKYKSDDSNVNAFSINRDASEMVNHLLVESTGPSGFSGDKPSQIKYGIFEEHITLTGLSVTNLLAAYGEAEILIKKQPRIKYTITPFVYKDGGSTPDPIFDYNTGEMCKIVAKRPPRINIDNTSVKVQSINIKIDDEGNEIVESLELYQ